MGVHFTRGGSKMSDKSPFDEKSFREDIFSASALKERERMIDEKRKLFEETESEEFRRNKERMLERMRAQQDGNTSSDTSNDASPSRYPPAYDNSSPDADQEKKEETEDSDEEILTADEIQQLVNEANEHKNNGNEYYRDGLWEAAINEYTKALSLCPKRESVRAVYYGNRAACYQNLLEYEKVVEDCTASLALDEKYVKVLSRRADAYEKLDKLEEALEDHKKIVELSPSVKASQRAVTALPPQIKIKQEREREEMMGKLKEVGNSLLGMVGLSLDNFQFTQDPNTGGYSVNFQNK